MKRIVILGKAGSFHEEAARLYFEEDIEVVSSSNFDHLSELLLSDDQIDFGVMAIENSIAGTILQNYRILRESNLKIHGEKYLRIRHNLIGLPQANIDDITKVYSHPMALHQCKPLLIDLGIDQREATADTVKAIVGIKEMSNKHMAAIGSQLAADLYGLKVLKANIESERINYTRFLIISKSKSHPDEADVNKASVYLRTDHQKGSLLRVLEPILENDINLSKLQSYPVPGVFNRYFFHLDLEFERIVQFQNLIPELEKRTQQLKVLGIYKRDKDQNSLVV